MGPHRRTRLAQRRRRRCLRVGHGTNVSGARPSWAAFGLGRVPTREQRAVHGSGGTLGRVVSASARAIAVAVSRVRLALCCPMICRVSGVHVTASTPQRERAAARPASTGPKNEEIGPRSQARRQSLRNKSLVPKARGREETGVEQVSGQGSRWLSHICRVAWTISVP